MIIKVHYCCHFLLRCTCVHPRPGVGHRNRGVHCTVEGWVYCTVQSVQCRQSGERGSRGWSDGPTLLSPPRHAGNSGALSVILKVMMRVMMIVMTRKWYLSDPCYSRCVMALQSVTPRLSTGSISDVILTQTALTRQHCSPLTGSRQQTQIKRGERGETKASQCRMSDLNTPHPDT